VVGWQIVGTAKGRAVESAKLPKLSIRSASQARCSSAISQTQWQLFVPVAALDFEENVVREGGK